MNDEGDIDDGGNERIAGFDRNDFSDGSANCGRKGVAYDWQSLYAATQAADLDGEWARLAATVAESP